ncbi:MAG: hypothetical protein AB8G23_11275 [Myxococcota bacterium]
MSEVSSIVVRLIAGRLPEFTDNVDALFEGLSPGPRDCRSSRERMSWDDFATLIERCSDRLGGNAALEELLGEGVASIRGISWILSSFSSHRAVFLLGARWVGPMVFRCVQGTEVDFEDGTYGQHLEILPGYRDCEAFFHLMKGGLKAIPMKSGTLAVDLDMTASGREATYGFNLEKDEEDLEASNQHVERSVELLKEMMEMFGEPVLGSFSPGPSESPKLAERVRHEIAKSLEGNERDASISLIAKRVGLSPRTLKRRL